MSDRPPKPTEEELHDARRHDGWIGDTFVDLKCGHPTCAVRRRAGWENKIMREAINEARARCDRDALALAILDAALEEIGR
ncbi:MAG: hypothetical protein WC683_10065 [bacterium]